MSKKAEKARAMGKKVIDVFASGNIAKPLAIMFLNMDSETPMFSWSFRNQLLCVASGMTDARGFRQWKEVDRFVKKGQSSYCSIFVPTFKKEDPDDTDSRLILNRFMLIPVFDVSQTDGAEMEVTETQQWLNERPLIEVAQHWGLSVSPLLNHPEARGSYSRSKISLRVKNLSTWFHELIHAADDKAGNLTDFDQTWANETVAELGQCVLSRMLGADTLDDGKAWRHISAYAEEEKINPLTACEMVLDRVATAVTLIMDTAKELNLTGDFFQTAQAEQLLEPSDAQV